MQCGNLQNIAKHFASTGTLLITQNMQRELGVKYVPRSVVWTSYASVPTFQQAPLEHDLGAPADTARNSSNIDPGGQTPGLTTALDRCTGTLGIQ